MRVFAVPNDPVKIIQLKLRNATAHMRRISVTYYAEWVLGSLHENTAPYIVPEFASNQFALLARNTYNLDFRQRVAFLASTREPSGVTTDRTEFLGKHGSYTRPAALERIGLTPRMQPGGDPCAALQLLIWLQPGDTKEVAFLLGQGADRNDTERLITNYQNIENIESAWQALGKFWDKHLGQIQVKTSGCRLGFITQPVVALPVISVSLLGSVGVLPTWRSLWLSRSITGCNGIYPCPARYGSSTYFRCCQSPVRGRRCASLVASASWTWGAHALFG